MISDLLLTTPLVEAGEYILSASRKRTCRGSPDTALAHLGTARNSSTFDGLPLQHAPARHIRRVEPSRSELMMWASSRPREVGAGQADDGHLSHSRHLLLRQDVPGHRHSGLDRSRQPPLGARPSEGLDFLAGDDVALVQVHRLPTCSVTCKQAWTYRRGWSTSGAFVLRRGMTGSPDLLRLYGSPRVPVVDVVTVFTAT